MCKRFLLCMFLVMPIFCYETVIVLLPSSDPVGTALMGTLDCFKGYDLIKSRRLVSLQGVEDKITLIFLQQNNNAEYAISQAAHLVSQIKKLVMAAHTRYFQFEHPDRFPTNNCSLLESYLALDKNPVPEPAHAYDVIKAEFNFLRYEEIGDSTEEEYTRAEGSAHDTEDETLLSIQSSPRNSASSTEGGFGPRRIEQVNL